MSGQGVFNAQQHQEELDMLMQGKIKQFQVVTVDLSISGFPGNLVGGKGLVELEGNSVAIMPSILGPDTNGSSAAEQVNTAFNRGPTLGQFKAPLYIKFNHPENPWLPIGMSKNSDVGSQVPVAYCLTFGRFWIYNMLTNPGGFAFLLVSRGVSIYSPSYGPVVIGGYQAPTWQQLK
jgi:hypothetical protein